MKAPPTTVLVMVTAALIGCAVGYFAGNDSAKIGQLRAELAKLRSDLDQARRFESSASKPRRPSISASQLAQPASNGPNPGAPQPFSPEWQAQRQAEYKQRSLESWVARTASDRSVEYTRVFSELGVSPVNAERFKASLVELHRRAIAAGEPLMELIQARIAYDQDVRSALGEENYRRYRTYEESKPAVREYQMFSEYNLNEKKIAIDPAYAEKITQLIKDASATTTERWEGPYDPLPRPAAGLEMVTNRMNQELIALKERSNVLLDTVRQAGLPDEYNSLIADYYAKTIREKEQQLSLLSRPMEEQSREMFREVEAQIQEREQQAKMRAREQQPNRRPP